MPYYRFTPGIRLAEWLLVGMWVGLCTATMGQTTQTLKGRIVDAKTGGNLPYVTIYIPARQIGTTANGDGNFQLIVPITAVADTVTFSIVGYQTYKLALNPAALSTENLTIRLMPAAVTLNEVTIRPIDPERTVREAVRRIRQNYADKPVLLQGFYRENVQEKAYLVFAEGSLELYKAAYGTYQRDEVRILKGRRMNLKPYFMSGSDTCLLPTITNGPHLGIILDIVKTPGDYAFLGSPRANEYTYEGTSELDGRDVLLIRFRARPNRDLALYDGLLYIERESLAIVQVDYELSRQGIRLANLGLNSRQLPLQLQHRQYRVRYMLTNGRWIIHDAQVRNQYTYLLHKSAPIRNRMDFVVTKITTQPVRRFPANEVISVDKAFAEEIRDFDEQFWAGETILIDEQNE